MFNPQKILILAPHPDDGELGCGGAIARFCQENKEVHYAAFSPCRKSLPADSPNDLLEKECKMAVQQLGLHPAKLLFYDFDVREFPAKRQDILEELVSLKKYIQPDLVMVPGSTDMHQDHLVIHHEALRAFRSSSVLGYELPWTQTRFHSSFFIQLTEDQIDRKVKALACYESQAHRDYMKNDFVRSLSKVRGVQCNTMYAEAFEVCRIIS